MPEICWISLYLFLGFRSLCFVLPMGVGWARNAIIFRGLRLLKTLNGPDGPRVCCLHLPRGSLLLQTAPQNIWRLPPVSHSTFVSVCQLPGSPFWAPGREWGFPPRHRALTVFICLSYLVCWPMYMETTIPPACVPTRRLQGQWLLLDFMADVWASTYLSPSALHHQPQGVGIIPLSTCTALGHPRSSPGSP